ncbi:MAG: FAD-dependent oxidoreductase [Proteobacteria bacterium]|nr:FAD-dependent oxidoreductase [Pseudomonadota bacterium]MCP4915417.1 FAD-dependent oxidoreductase [Pseudomonadota bacterium]
MTLLLLACTAPDTDSGWTHSDPLETGDTGEEPLEPKFDVLVIGSGPAGLIAAREAQELGATVLIVEMASHAGGAAWFAGRFLGVETEHQTNRGIEDSVETALSEWESITGAVPDAVIESFLDDSSDVLRDLVDRYDVAFTGPDTDRDAGAVERVHTLDGSTLAAGLLSETYDIRLDTRADSLVVEDGRVVGVQVTDLLDDSTTRIGASTVVVTTGGFARDLERVRRDRPGLTDALLVPETHPTALGLGHDMLEEVGAGWQNAGAYGVYVHSFESDGEAVLVHSIRHAMVVDGDGQRVFDELTLNYFESAETLEALVPPRLVLLASPGAATELAGTFLSYEPGVDHITAKRDELVEAGVLTLHEDITAAASAYGLGDGISATVEAYDRDALDGVDDEHGKPGDHLHPFGEDPVWAGGLAAGAAKAFTGVPLDERGRVLDIDGAPIPGVFAAGEVAGMLGTDAVGSGFTGSVTAVLWSGQRAGREAATDALAE